MLFEISFSHPDYDGGDDEVEAFIDCLEAELEYFNVKVNKHSSSQFPAELIFTERK